MNLDVTTVEVRSGSISLADVKLLQTSLASKRSRGQHWSEQVISTSYDTATDAVVAWADLKTADQTALLSGLETALSEIVANDGPAVRIEHRESPVPPAGRTAPAVANTSIDPRVYGGAMVVGPTGLCTQSFHVHEGAAILATTNAHCALAHPGVWSDGMGQAFGGTGPWNQNEVWQKQSWPRYFNSTCSDPTPPPWIYTGKTGNWAWADVALLDFWGASQALGRVYDPTHGYIRVRETMIPTTGDWVMTYGANSNPGTQRIVYVSQDHIDYEANMNKSPNYWGGAAQCLRAYIQDSFYTNAWGSTPQIIGGDSGGPVTMTVWRNINGTIEAIAKPTGIISNLGEDGSAWHSYMHNVNYALRVWNVQG